MGTITRYVFSEVSKIFAVALTALTLLLLIVGLVREATDQGLGLPQVVLLIPYILPDALRYTVPGTSLFAVCSVFGRMSGSNEIVALKSLGISPLVLLWPVLALVFLLSLGTVWLNDVAVSWGRHGVRRVVIESVEEIAYGMLRTHRAYKAGTFSIHVKRVDGHKLVNPTISIDGKNGEPSITLTAEEAELRSDIEANLLSIICRDGELQVEGQGTVQFRGTTIERAIPLDAGMEDETGYPSWMALRIIPGEIVKQKEKIAAFEQELASLATFQMVTGDFAAMINGEWISEAALLKNYKSHLYRLQTEPHRRWANGFSCLCFALVGAPLAVRMRNTDFLKSFFACFFPILCVYYPLMASTVGQAKDGLLPATSVWIGNVVAGVIGAWQLRKVLRY